MNYKADKVTLPSVRGLSKNGLNAVGTTSDPEPASKKDVTSSSQNYTLDTQAIGQWFPMQASGCSVWLIAGKIGDTVTAVATGPGMKLADGQMYHALITTNTQKLGYISTGSFTGGLLIFPSCRDD